MKELHLIPSMAGAKALACSLNDHELAVRTAEWRRISARAESRRAEKGRVVATYPRDEELLSEIRRLIAAEGECCSSLTFTVEELADRVVVELAVPDVSAGSASSDPGVSG